METGPTTRWVGPETLVDVVLEGCEASALADSGSQVNTNDAGVRTRMRLPSFAIKWACKLPTTFGGAGWLTHMSLGICDCKASS